IRQSRPALLFQAARRIHLDRVGLRPSRPPRRMDRRGRRRGMTAPFDTWPEYTAAAEGQAQAALPDHAAWVEANAGSGKTKVLIDRLARLLLRGVKPDSILCVTYTKAAASERQARLFARLGEWCVMEGAALKEQLSKLEGR